MGRDLGAALCWPVIRPWHRSLLNAPLVMAITASRPPLL